MFVCYEKVRRMTELSDEESLKIRVAGGLSPCLVKFSEFFRSKRYKVYRQAYVYY